MRALLVEDIDDVADAVVARLTARGDACDRAADCEGARDFLSVQSYDAIILDVNLPDGSGLELLSELRARKVRTPVLILTAQFEVGDRVSALDAGADDYLVKPFDLRELEARLRALLRRYGGAGAGAQLELGALSLDPAAKVATLSDRPMPLTRRELALLEMFLRNPGQLLSKERLHEGLYSFEDCEVSLNAIELYVGRLRKKLDGSNVAITTQRGLGYRIDVG